MKLILIELKSFKYQTKIVKWFSMKYKWKFQQATLLWHTKFHYSQISIYRHLLHIWADKFCEHYFVVIIISHIQAVHFLISIDCNVINIRHLS